MKSTTVSYIFLRPNIVVKHNILENMDIAARRMHVKEGNVECVLMLLNIFEEKCTSQL